MDLHFWIISDNFDGSKPNGFQTLKPKFDSFGSWFLPVGSFTTLLGGWLSEIRVPFVQNTREISKKGWNQFPRFGCLNQSSKFEQPWSLKSRWNPSKLLGEKYPINSFSQIMLCLKIEWPPEITMGIFPWFSHHVPIYFPAIWMDFPILFPYFAHEKQHFPHRKPPKLRGALHLGGGDQAFVQGLHEILEPVLGRVGFSGGFPWKNPWKKRWLNL